MEALDRPPRGDHGAALGPLTAPTGPPNSSRLGRVSPGLQSLGLRASMGARGRLGRALRAMRRAAGLQAPAVVRGNRGLPGKRRCKVARCRRQGCKAARLQDRRATRLEAATHAMRCDAMRWAGRDYVRRRAWRRCPVDDARRPGAGPAWHATPCHRRRDMPYHARMAREEDAHGQHPLGDPLARRGTYADLLPRAGTERSRRATVAHRGQPGVARGLLQRFRCFDVPALASAPAKGTREW